MHRLALAGERFAQPLQPVQALAGVGMGDECALALQPQDQPFLLQVTQGLANRDAADAMGGTELAFGGQLLVRLQPAFQDARTQLVAQPGVQRLRRFRHGPALLAWRLLACHDLL